LSGKGKRKVKDRTGRALAEGEKETREELAGGHWAGERQESVPDVPVATLRLKRNRRRRRRM
jgi:hypothetical protein